MILTSITTRGRLLLTSGITLVALSLLLGQRDLMHAALLCTLLPLLSVGLVSRSKAGLVASRSVTANRVTQGTEVQVTVRFKNNAHLPTGTILLNESSSDLPDQHFTLDRVAPQGRRQLTYVVRPDRRGIYTVGPLRATIVDPFGLAQIAQVFKATESIIVLPQVHVLSPRQYRGRREGGSQTRTNAINISGEDDVVPRPYRIGDELRRIHWKASAKTGDLMVRHEEQPWRTSATVIMDLREHPKFEWIVSAAASVVNHMLRQGFAVHLLDTANHLLGSADDGHALDNLQTVLALVQPQPTHRIAVGTTTDNDSGDTVVIALLSAMDHNNAMTIAGIRRGRHGIALLVTNDDDSQATASLLAAQGWTVKMAEPGDTPSQTWARLSTTKGSR